MADVEQRTFEIRNAHGLHARPAALFVQTASKYNSAIILRNLSRGGKEVNAKSIMDVLTAGVDHGARIEIVAEGEDASEALNDLAQLIESNLGEA